MSRKARFGSNPLGAARRPPQHASAAEQSRTLDQHLAVRAGSALVVTFPVAAVFLGVVWGQASASGKLVLLTVDGSQLPLAGRFLRVDSYRLGTEYPIELRAPLLMERSGTGRFVEAALAIVCIGGPWRPHQPPTLGRDHLARKEPFSPSHHRGTLSRSSGYRTSCPC